MNRIFRIVWNKALGVFVVASELARTRGGAGNATTTVSRPARSLIFTGLLLAGAISSVHAADAGSTITNASFEDGTLAGWTTSTTGTQDSGSYGSTGAGVSVVTGMSNFDSEYGDGSGTHSWTVTPYGGYMASIQTGGADTFASGATALGLTGDSQSAIGAFLAGSPTDAAWIYQDIVLNAGDSFTMAWQYVSTDYEPWNDSSFTSLVNLADPGALATVNNHLAQYAVLGATNLGTGDYSTGSYGATGWEVATYSVATSGTYRLGFLSFNLNDSANSPILLIDQQPGETFDKGVPFAPIAPNEGSGAPTPPPTSVTITTPTTTTDLGSTDGVFDGGTLVADGDGTLDQDFTINSNGGTIDQAGHQLTLDGAISDAGSGEPGSLVIVNSGDGGGVVLTGTNTYTGTTTIDDGATLALGGDGSISDSAGLTNNGTFDISGANGNVDVATLDGSGTIDLGGNDLNLTNATGSFGGSIGGTGGVTVTAGSESLSGTGTYTGATTIGGGATLALTGDGSIADSSGVTAEGTFDISGANDPVDVVSLDGGGAVDLGGNDLNLTGAAGTFAGTIDGTGGVHVSGGSETLSGTNTYTGTTTIDGGATLALNGDGSLADSSGITVEGTFDISGANDDAEVTTLDGTGNVLLGDNSLELTGASGSFGGTIDGNGGVIISGGTEVLSGTNTYTGGTTLTGGTLQVGDDANLGEASGGLTFDGGTLEITGDVDSDRAVTLVGDGTFDTGAETTMTNAGDVAGSGALVKDGAGTLELDGTLSHGGGTVVNDGTLVLTGTNTYTGGTTLNGGTLQIEDDSNLGADAGGLTFDGGTLHTTGSLATDRQITLAGDGSIDVDAGTTLTASDAIDGDGRLVKQGDGTLVLTGANVYTGGTTIEAGTLQGDSTSLHGDIVDDGTLVFAQAGNGTFGGGISGSGNLVKDGTGTLIISGTATHQGGTTVNAGTLVLSGTHTYTGGTTINDGQLQVSRDANLGDASSDLTLDGGTLHTTGSFASGRDVTLGGGSFTTDAGTTFTSAGALAGSGGLVKDGQGTMVVNGVASHQGGTAVNAGVLVLTGTNTYTGGTTINGGELQVSRDANLGHASSELALNGGTLHTTGTLRSGRDITLGGGSFTTDAGTTFTSAGTLAGAGGLVKNGQGTMVVDGAASHRGGTTVNAGVLILNGDNTYTGGTTLNGGSLRVSRDTSLGEPAGGITFNGGDLTITQSMSTDRDMTIGVGNASITTLAGVTLTANGDMSGAGGLVKRGGGTLVVSGNNTFAGGTLIDGGVIKIDSGSSLGTGVIVLHGGTLQTVETLGTGQKVLVSGDSGVDVDAGKTARLSGQILTDGNAGCFVKSGSGTLDMTGAATLANGTCVQEGMLRANGELTSRVQVDKVGTLRGVGLIDGAVNVEGTLAPGNSPGTLAVSGAVTMHEGSTLQIDIDGYGTAAGKGNYSRLLAGGPVVLAGTLAPTLRGITGNASNAFTPELGDVFSVVQAAGGIEGTFDALRQPTAGLAANTRFQVFYVGGHAVDLYVTPASYATLLDGQANGNTVRVGEVVDRMVAAQDAGTDTADQHALLFALAGQRAAALPGTMQSLAGEAHAQEAAMAREASLGLAGDMADHLAEAPAGGVDHGSRAWVTLSQGGYRASSDAVASGFRTQQSRTSVGLDAYRGDAAVWGVGLAHTESRLEETPASGSVRGDGVLLYGEVTAGKFRIDGSTSWTRDDWRTRRADPLAPAQSMYAQADGHGMAASVAARLPIQRQGMRIEPYAQAIWQRVSREGFVESGDALTRLTVGSYAATGTRLLAGVNLGSFAQDPLAASVTYRVGAAVGHDFGDTLNPELDATLDGESFALRGPSMGRNLLKLDASGTLRLGRQTYLYGGLNSVTGGDRASYGVNAGVRVQF